MTTLTLYFRDYCSLCHTMREALHPWVQRYGLTIQIVDVDADPALEARFNELVPVLMHNEVEICHWYLDKERLAAYLDKIR